VFPAVPDEQRRIVACLVNLQAQVDELTALQDATQVELDALLPSVLDRAFRGEVKTVSCPMQPGCAGEHRKEE
jgi:type I restriction enzyme S subunit